jgi:lycopene beta-cyclase
MQGEAEHIVSNGNETYVMVDGKKIKGKYIFNSIIFQKPALTDRHLWLLQHFAGWFIETDKDVFNPESAMLMDFDTDQSMGTAFFYVLPFSKTKALVEYTLFSPALLKPVEYETALRNYITETLQISSYTVYEKESGSIPMTNYHFPKGENKIVNIGTAGGQTKASSGYTFRFIQKHSARIADSLAKAGNPTPATDTARFVFYDSVLLRILSERKLEGREIFQRLFEKNGAANVLKFLDNETSLTEELPIISSLPTLPFLKAAIKQTGISG